MEARIEHTPKKAVLLAPDGKGRGEVFGIPAVRRLILLHLQLGVREIHLIGQVNTLQPVLADLVPPERFHQTENPEGLDGVVQNLHFAEGERVLAMKSNHVIDRLSLARFMEAGNHDTVFVLEAKGENPERLFSVTPADLVPVLRHLWSPARQPLLPGNARPVAGVDGFPYAVEEGKGAAIAEHKLMEAQASQTRESDGFLARHVNRRVSRFISSGLVSTPVTPNQITLVGAGIGFSGAFLLSFPGYWPKVIGAFLFLLCIIVDGVDGEIARLKLKATPFGHYLDVILDNAVHVAIFLGMAVGLYRDSGSPVYFYRFGLLLGGFGICGLAVYQCILKTGARPLRESGKTLRLMALLSNRDFAYIIVALALAGRISWFLTAAAFGTYVFAALLWTVSFYERRASGA